MGELFHNESSFNVLSLELIKPYILFCFPLRHLGVIIPPIIVLFQQKEVLFSFLCCVGKIYPIRIAVLNSLCETSANQALLPSSYLEKQLYIWLSSAKEYYVF